MPEQPNPIPPANQEDRDLGFGSVLSRQPLLRLLNRDGTFNVRRKKTPALLRFTRYHGLLSVPWWQFVAFVTTVYFAVNVIFAVAYVLCGPGALRGEAVPSNFWSAFFFSVQTFSTVGYGSIVPIGFAANAVASVESLVGLMGFAIAAGLVFARYARPTARIVYSRRAVVSPYRGITAFEFRIINARSNQIIDLEATVVLTRFEGEERTRRYYTLPLERKGVAFFPLAWTVVHPIDSESPLNGWDEARLLHSNAEFLILLRGTDETFAQTVHSRTSYAAGEVVWNVRFANLFQTSETVPTVDMRRFDLLEGGEAGVALQPPGAGPAA